MERQLPLLSQAVPTVLQRFVTAEDADFQAAVLERLKTLGYDAAAPDEVLQAAAKYALSRLLHQAYCQDGSSEQARALQAAHAWMYAIALRQCRGDETVACEIAQQALEASWSRRLQIRDPGAFTYYLIQTCVHLVQQWYRAQGRRPTEPLDPAEGDGDDQARPASAALALVSAEDTVVDQLWIDQLRAVVRECLKRHPRFVQIIEEHFFAGSSFKDMATRWGRPAAQLHLDKFRALKHLRACAGLTRFLNSWNGATTLLDA